MKNNKDNMETKIAKLLKPSSTAILIIDMMDAYCDKLCPLPIYLTKDENASFDYLEIVSDRIVNFLDESRHYNIKKYIFVKMLERADTVLPNIALKMRIENIPNVVEKNGVGWNYYKVIPKKGDMEIEKFSYDAFLNTNLDKYLKHLSIKTIIIVGGYTSVCVDSTARTASQLGYHTFVPADLTADPGVIGEEQSPEIIKKKLYAINNVMGYMPSSKQILNNWKNLSQ